MEGRVAIEGSQMEGVLVEKVGALLVCSPEQQHPGTFQLSGKKKLFEKNYFKKGCGEVQIMCLCGGLINK